MQKINWGIIWGRRNTIHLTDIVARGRRPALVPGIEFVMLFRHAPDGRCAFVGDQSIIHYQRGTAPARYDIRYVNRIGDSQRK